MDHEAAKARVKKYLEQNPVTKEMLEHLLAAEDLATCKKCRRVIYCGVNRLCKELECGLKHGNKK